MIDFYCGEMPKGFSKELNKCFELVTIDIYATSDFTERTINLFFSEDDYYLVKPNGKEHVHYRELGRYELVDAIFCEGDYLHSFFLAENIFTNEDGKKVKLIALLYQERHSIHIWNPYFEELFLPLILDDLENENDSHWRSIQEIHQNRSIDLDVCKIAIKNEVDYEIEGFNVHLYFNTVVYYALLKHIFIVEDEKYPDIPGSFRTLLAYKNLYEDHLNNCVDIEKWRRKYRLRDPFIK